MMTVLKALCAIALIVVAGRVGLVHFQRHDADGESAANPHSSAPVPSQPDHYEFYQIDSRFAELHDPSWLLKKDIINWPGWVLTALTNYLYCKKHGYALTLWAIPESRLTQFTNRGWGNSFVAHYIKTRLDQGAWPQRDWLVYLDSDSYVRRREMRVEEFLASQPMYTPLEIEKGNANRMLQAQPNTIKALQSRRKVENMTEEVFVLGAAEVPLPLVLPAIAPDSWINSGVLFFNLRHRLSQHLLTRWARSVTDLCGNNFRFARLADQHCLNVLFFRGNRSEDYMNHVAFLDDPTAFNTPAGDFIRHPWSYHQFHRGLRPDHPFMLFGMDLVSQGYRSTNQFHDLLHEMIDSGALRQLPVVTGPNSPAYRVNGTDWDIQTEEMAAEAGVLMRDTWQTRHSRAAVADKKATFVPAASSSECLVAAARNFSCGIVTWRVGKDMTGSCSCYTAGADTHIVILRFATTWVRTQA